MKVIIIGGVAGGATAAARIRRLDEKAEIVILERSGFVSLCQLRPALLHRGRHRRPGGPDLQTPQGFGTASGWTCGYATRPPPLTRRASRSRSRT